MIAFIGIKSFNEVPSDPNTIYSSHFFSLSLFLLLLSLSFRSLSLSFSPLFFPLSSSQLTHIKTHRLVISQKIPASLLSSPLSLSFSFSSLSLPSFHLPSFFAHHVTFFSFPKCHFISIIFFFISHKSWLEETISFLLVSEWENERERGRDREREREFWETRKKTDKDFYPYASWLLSRFTCQDAFLYTKKIVITRKERKLEELSKEIQIVEKGRRKEKERKWERLRRMTKKLSSNERQFMRERANEERELPLVHFITLSLSLSPSFFVSFFLFLSLSLSFITISLSLSLIFIPYTLYLVRRDGGRKFSLSLNERRPLAKKDGSSLIPVSFTSMFPQ